MDDFIRAVSNQNRQMDCRENTDSTVYKFRTVISMLNRRGHALFRRALVRQEVTRTPPPPRTLNLLSGSQETAAAIGGFVKDSDTVMMDKEWFSLSNSGNSSSTLLSSIIGVPSGIVEVLSVKDVGDDGVCNNVNQEFYALAPIRPTSRRPTVIRILCSCSHQGTVISMEPNEGTFVLHSEKGQIKPIHIVDVPGHSRL